jgi:hypothetical protein
MQWISNTVTEVQIKNVASLPRKTYRHEDGLKDRPRTRFNGKNAYFRIRKKNGKHKRQVMFFKDDDTEETILERIRKAFPDHTFKIK